MSSQEALAADRAGDLVLAAKLYEAAIAKGESSLDAFLNLALLYWQSTDPGMAASKRLTAAFMNTASRRMTELLEEAERRHPSSTAVKFWKRYIAWTDLGGPAPEKSFCRGLLREAPTVLVPAMYLFSASDGLEAKVEATELLQQARADGTTGARYVSSFLEATMETLR